jgi:transposase
MQNKIVVGIDVAKDFSYFALIGPDNKQIGKQFRVNHTLEELEDVVKRMKEVETRLKSQCVLIMESTGHYSSILFNFFHRSNFEVYLINPLQTNSIKNLQVRKVKNDKIDAYRIAMLFKLGELRPYLPPREDLAKIKVLCRHYYKLVDDSVMYKNDLIALVNQIFPGYQKIFSDITSLSSLYVLENYSSPKKLLNADRDELISNLNAISKRGLDWANKKADALISMAKSAIKLKSAPITAGIALKSCIAMLKAFHEQIKHIENEIIALSNDVEEIKLVDSITGIGPISAATIVSEIRDFENFSSPKKLVAFCGIDPAVMESGNFKGSKVKISKRGSRYLRRVLYIAALANIKQYNGKYINSVLAEYYQAKIQSKPKKVALVAVMHKLVNYIFAVLRDKKPFKVITPEEQMEIYAQKTASAKQVA